MSRFTTLMSAAAVAFTGGYAALPAPAVAQAQPNIAEIIVYGNDPCPRSTDDQVVVCARRPEAERYRTQVAERITKEVEALQGLTGWSASEIAQRSARIKPKGR